MTSMESDTAAEGIVDNKTVRIDKEGQSSETSDNHKVCHGCNAVGHVLESCPENHGLNFTNCQLYQIGQTNASTNKTKPTGTGIEQLSVCFQNLAKSPPASSTPPILWGPPMEDAGNNDTTILSPNTATQQKCVEMTTELVREEPPPTTQQPNQTTTTDANRLLSSLGVQTETGTSKVSPTKKKPEEVPNKFTRIPRPVHTWPEWILGSKSSE